MTLKLFLWEDVLLGYTAGVMFALAENVESARELIVKRYADFYSHHWALSDYKKYRRGEGMPSSWAIRELWHDLDKEPQVIETEFGFYLRGGG